MKEHAVTFGATGSLVGVITEPTGPGPKCEDTAIIFLNAGIIHHVGPNRIYVKIARELSEAGLTTMRIDFSGIGDSATRTDGLPFDRSGVSEIQDAMNYLATEFGADRFIIGGICSGASMAFKVACCDQRVTRVVMINAQEFISDDLLASYIKNKSNVDYYWKTAMVSRASWSKLMRGQINFGNLAVRLMSLAKKRLTNVFGRRRQLARKTGPIYADFQALVGRGVDLLLVYSEMDPGITEIELIFSRKIDRIGQEEGLVLETVRQTDHTFTSLASQTWLIDRIGEWLQDIPRHPLSASSPQHLVQHDATKPP